MEIVPSGVRQRIRLRIEQMLARAERILGHEFWLRAYAASEGGQAAAERDLDRWLAAPLADLAGDSAVDWYEAICPEPEEQQLWERGLIEKAEYVTSQITPVLADELPRTLRTWVMRAVVVGRVNQRVHEDLERKRQQYVQQPPRKEPSTEDLLRSALESQDPEGAVAKLLHPLGWNLSAWAKAAKVSPPTLTRLIHNPGPARERVKPETWTDLVLALGRKRKGQPI